MGLQQPPNGLLLGTVALSNRDLTFGIWIKRQNAAVLWKTLQAYLGMVMTLFDVSDTLVDAKPSAQLIENSEVSLVAHCETRVWIIREHPAPFHVLFWLIFWAVWPRIVVSNPKTRFKITN